jgi:hypothetical protein
MFTLSRQNSCQESFTVLTELQVNIKLSTQKSRGNFSLIVRNSVILPSDSTKTIFLSLSESVDAHKTKELKISDGFRSSNMNNLTKQMRCRGNLSNGKKATKK